MSSTATTLIFGAGAIGQWLGALLFSSGEDVLLYCRPRVAAAIDKQGGIVLNGRPALAVPTSCRLKDLKKKHFASVISTVKTYAVESALDDMEKSGLTFDNLISFQNGWGTDEAYLDAFPKAKLWALTTTRAVGVEHPGRLTPSSKGGLAVAPWNTSLPRVVPPSLRRVTIPLVRLERALDLKWSKLLLNIIGNATGAITGLSPQHLANQPHLMRTELELARETLAVGRALGARRVDLPSFPVKILAQALEKMPLRLVSPLIAARLRRGRGDKLPSLFFDLEDPTRPTEIDNLNGAIVKEGERLGISTPKQAALVKLFHRCRADQELWKQLRANPSLLMDYV